MITSTYTIAGMTCDHCVAAVSSEVSAIPAVEAVVIELASGTVTVVSAAPLDIGAVRAAVDEAGYTLEG